jgi:hypothetical protein
MKKKFRILWLASVIVAGSAIAQDKEAPQLLTGLHYFARSNSLQWIEVQTKLKENNKLRIVENVVLQLYLDSVAPQNLISKVRTNERGEARATLPMTVKENWLASNTHKFIAITEATQKSDETTTELEITRSKILLDTANELGTRTVGVHVFSFDGNGWMPAKDVEVKIGARRLGGELKIGDAESYTTDSLGEIAAEFHLDSLPSDDAKGFITLVAKTEDNDLFGSISVEGTVPWGVYVRHESNFGQRSLWATRHRAPVWLLAMAYSMMSLVWIVIIFLCLQLLKIIRLSRTEASRAKTIKKPDTLAEVN